MSSVSAVEPSWRQMIIVLAIMLACGAGIYAGCQALFESPEPRFVHENLYIPGVGPQMIEAETFPGTIEVTFDDPGDIARNEGIAVKAYVDLTPTSCHVHLPTGMRIVGNSVTGWAGFPNSRDREVLAHELLHCLAGFWHGNRGVSE